MVVVVHSTFFIGEYLKMGRQEFFTELHHQHAILWPALNAHRCNADGKDREELDDLCSDWEQLTDKLQRLKSRSAA